MPLHQWKWTINLIFNKKITHCKPVLQACSADLNYVLETNWLTYFNLFFALSWFQLETKVVSCQPAKLSVTRDGKKQVLSGFQVVCEDTILFPEGGGQVRGFHKWRHQGIHKGGVETGSKYEWCTLVRAVCACTASNRPLISSDFLICLNVLGLFSLVCL